MKKFFFVATIAAFAVACNNSGSEAKATDSTKMAVDSTKMATDSTKMATDSTKMAADTTKKDTSAKK